MTLARKLICMHGAEETQKTADAVLERLRSVEYGTRTVHLVPYETLSVAIFIQDCERVELPSRVDDLYMPLLTVSVLLVQLMPDGLLSSTCDDFFKMVTDFGVSSLAQHSRVKCTAPLVVPDQDDTCVERGAADVTRHHDVRLAANLQIQQPGFCIRTSKHIGWSGDSFTIFRRNVSQSHPCLEQIWQLFAHVRVQCIAVRPHKPLVIGPHVQ